MTMGLDYEQAAEDALAESLRARVLWAPFNSAREGFAFLWEAVDELKAHVRTSRERRDYGAMRAEAIQVAAMAIAFAVEICDTENRT